MHHHDIAGVMHVFHNSVSVHVQCAECRAVIGAWQHDTPGQTSSGMAHALDVLAAHCADTHGIELGRRELAAIRNCDDG